MDATTPSRAPVNPPVRLANPRRVTLASFSTHEERRRLAMEHAQEREAS